MKKRRPKRIVCGEAAEAAAGDGETAEAPVIYGSCRDPNFHDSAP